MFIYGGDIHMLYIDKPVQTKSDLTFRFENIRDRENDLGLTGTHEKSSNWNDLDDGLWERLKLTAN